jgi:hypothetical protein
MAASLRLAPEILRQFFALFALQCRTFTQNSVVAIAAFRQFDKA